MSEWKSPEGFTTIIDGLSQAAATLTSTLKLLKRRKPKDVGALETTVNKMLDVLHQMNTSHSDLLDLHRKQSAEYGKQLYRLIDNSGTVSELILVMDERLRRLEAAGGTKKSKRGKKRRK